MSPAPVYYNFTVISPRQSSSPTIIDVPDPTCDEIDRCRTLWHVIVGCALTVWACTWVCLHHNIPPRHEEWYQRILRHAGVTLMALIAPELVVTWALQQWYVARKITRKITKNPDRAGWTNTHSLFAIMGGYVLYEIPNRHSGESQDSPKATAQDVTVLDVDDDTHFEKLFASEDSCAGFHEGEIADKGKKDWLSKTVATCEALYFVATCLARAVEHIAVSQLELSTCAFAVLSGITYFLWWDKPHNVLHYLPVGRMPHWRAQDKPQRNEPHTADSELSWWRKSLVLTYTILPFLDMVSPTSASARETIRPGRTYVSTFHTGRIEEEDKHFIFHISAAISVIFGAIHCVAWNFEFPSVVEKLMWRVSSLIIMSFPLAALAIWHALGTINKEMSAWKQRIWYISVGSGISLYVLARATLVGLALSTLRALPNSILDATLWTQLIPHLWG